MYSAPAIKQGTLPQVITLNECDPIAVKNCLKENGALIVRAGSSLADFEELSNYLMTPMVHHSTSTTIERDVANADGTTSTFKCDRLALIRVAIWCCQDR